MSHLGDWSPFTSSFLEAEWVGLIQEFYPVFLWSFLSRCPGVHRLASPNRSSQAFPVVPCGAWVRQWCLSEASLNTCYLLPLPPLPPVSGCFAIYSLLPRGNETQISSPSLRCQKSAASRMDKVLAECGPSPSMDREAQGTQSAVVTPAPQLAGCSAC